MRTTILTVLLFATCAFARPQVRVIRVPDHGVQPEAAVDGENVVHLIYLTGDSQAADIQYITAPAGTMKFSEPVRVNSQAGSAIAIGTMRGPHLSVEARGRAHVAWMGSSQAQPRAPGKYAPMLYTHQGDDGRFEPQRNVLTRFVGLDGGGTVAVGRADEVYVAWHAPDVTKGDESTRRVFVARSRDGGKTFAPERPIDDERLGACACCGMELLASSGGEVACLFRTATKQIHRDTRAVVFDATLNRRWAGVIDPAESGICVMSTYALANVPAHDGFLAAWETLGRIRFGICSYRDNKAATPQDVPGAALNSKHPAVAINQHGQFLIAWAKDTGWQKGGSVAWQVFDANLRPIQGASGLAPDLPVWSKPAALVDPGGNFIVLY